MMADRDNKTKEFNCFLNSEWEFFKNYDAEFNRVWEDMQTRFGSEFIDHIHNYLQQNQFMLVESGNFTIELVVDTNVIFAEILSILRGKPSCLKSIITNPFLMLYAPAEIQSEVEKAIIEDLPKRYNGDDARKIAKELLSHVNILESGYSKAWLKAQGIMSQRDKTDIPFLALALSVEAHGIISRDLDFCSQEIVRIWDLGETGRMVSRITKGSFTFFILNLSVAGIWEMCRSLCVIFLKAVTAVLKGLVVILVALFQGGTEILTRISPWIFAVGVGAIVIALLLWKKAREKSGEILHVLWNWIQAVAKKIARLFAEIIKSIKAFIETIMPVVSYLVKGIGFLFYSSNQFMITVRDLDNLRAKSS